MLAGHWAVMEEQAADHGTTVDRRNWRMMGPMHIAETEQEALDNCRYGLERVFDYLGHVVPTGPVTATTYEGRVKEMNESGSAVIGTPGDGDRPDPAARRPVGRLRRRSSASAATSPTSRRPSAPTS